MPQASRVQSFMRRASIGMLVVAVLTSVPLRSEAQKPAPQKSGVTEARQASLSDVAAAQAEFQKRMAAYLTLREELSRKVKPLSTTADSGELTVRQETLAAAMKSARQHAKPGDLIPPLVAKQIAETVAADLRRRKATTRQATLEEVPDTVRPAINKTYPASAALPTVPALLLADLPKLPDNLQYRFYGRHVVLLDGDLQIIADFVANALPPH